MFYFIITNFLNTLFSHVKERDCKHLQASTIIEIMMGSYNGGLAEIQWFNVATNRNMVGIQYTCNLMRLTQGARDMLAQSSILFGI